MNFSYGSGYENEQSLHLDGNRLLDDESNDSISLGTLLQINIYEQHPLQNPYEGITVDVGSLKSLPQFNVEEIDELLNDSSISDNSLTKGYCEVVVNPVFFSNEHIDEQNFNENGSFVTQHFCPNNSQPVCPFTFEQNIVTQNPSTFLNGQELKPQNVVGNHTMQSPILQLCNQNLQSPIQKKHLSAIDESFKIGPSRVKKSKKPSQKNQQKIGSNSEVETRGRKRIYPVDEQAEKERHKEASKKSYHKCQSAAVKSVQRNILEGEVIAAETLNSTLKTQINGLYNRMMELSKNHSWSNVEKIYAGEKLSAIHKINPQDSKPSLIKEIFELD